MRFSTLAASAVCLALSMGSAVAGDQDFTLVNKTGYEINKVFGRESGTRDWGSDILGRDTLDDGESVLIKFDHDENACKWDMRVVYSDNDTSTWTGLNLCKISKVTLFWDRRNQRTTARLD